MFAGAAFTDQADINDANSDAVELLTTLDIIKGYEDGSFQPDGTVTRAEMAKMIYTIRNNGNDDASAYETVSTSFTDIKGHWAEGYIKYLQNTGIVAGKSAYIFDPDSTVTTGEAMKMALVLAGYRADKAELTGSKWLNNTVSLATTVGMTKDVQSAIAGGCTRQDAAQILANTLTEVTAVQWSEFVGAFVNDSKSGLAMGGAAITVGNKWMDLTVYVGKMVSSGEMAVRDTDDATVATAGKDRFKVDVDTIDNVAYDPDNNDTIVTFKDGKDHTDLVGQEVKVLTGTKIDEVYGVYATGTSQVVESTMDKAEFDKNDLKVDGTTYDIETNARVYTDNAAGVPVAASALATYGDVQKVADSIKLIDWDNNGDYETIITNTVSVAKVTSVNSTSVTLGVAGGRDTSDLGNNATLKFKDDTIYEGVAKNDYAVVTLNQYTGDWVVEKAEVVSGTVDGKVDNERKVRVDGTWYTLANRNDANPATLCVIKGGRDTFENGDAVTLYVVGNIAYYAESTKGNDANRSVLMVYGKMTGAGSWNDTDQAKVILADGTKKTVDIDTEKGKQYGDLVVGKMYYYEVNNDGEYSFTKLDSSVTAGYESVGTANNIGIVKDKINGVAIADEAIVFVLIDGNDAKVYTGKTVKNADIDDGWGKTVNGQYLTETENGFKYARMLNVAITSNETLRTATNYGYLTADAMRTKVNGTWYMQYEFWDGEKNVVAREETDADNTEFGKGDIISFAYTGATMARAETADSYVMIDDVVCNNDADVVYAAMTGVSGSTLQLLSGDKSQVTADVTSNTIIFYVDSANSDVSAIGVTGRDDYDYTVGLNDAGEYPINVAYVLNNDGDVELLVIDVEGQLKGKGTVAKDATGTLVLDGTTDVADAISNTTKSTVKFADGVTTIALNNELSIPKGTTIDWNDVTSVTLGSSAVIKGNVTLPNVSSVASGAKVASGSTLTIEGTATGLDNLTGEYGAKLVLKAAYTAEGTDKFFVGTAPAAVAADGTTFPAGTTFTYTENADGTNAGWLAAKAASKEIAFSNVAAIEAALKLTDNLTVTGAATLANALTIGANQKVTFTDAVATDDDNALTINGEAVFEDDLTVSGAKMLVINGSAEVQGALVTSSTNTFTGGTATTKGTLTTTTAQAPSTSVENVANDAYLTLVMKAETSAAVSASKWSIGGYDVAASTLKAPAGTYTIAAASKWTLDTIDAKSDVINVSGTITNTVLGQLFSKTSKVVLDNMTSDAATVLADKTLVLKAVNTSNIDVFGALELSGDKAWNLDKITGRSYDATVKFTGLDTASLTDNSNGYAFYGSDLKKLATNVNSNFSNVTFKYTANVDGAASGFVAQIAQ